MLRYWRIFLIVIVFCSLAFTACLTLPAGRQAAGRLLTSSIGKPNVLSTIFQKEREVDVTARVGKYKIEKLTGWSSPFSEITLSSRYTFRKTSADEKGFFAFYSIPIDETRGLCLISQDVNLFPSFPLCLAPLAENQDIIMENVLLSPTISIESNQILFGKTTKASGMTFPDSPVDVYFFTENKYNFQFLKSVYAVGLPRYRVKSNVNGYFEFSLPPNSPSESRVFVIAKKQGPCPFEVRLCRDEGGSPKSNTLSFQAFNLWAYLKIIFGNFKINCSILFILIVIETLILIVLLGLFLGKKKKKEYLSCPLIKKEK